MIEARGIEIVDTGCSYCDIDAPMTHCRAVTNCEGVSYTISGSKCGLAGKCGVFFMCTVSAEFLPFTFSASTAWREPSRRVQHVNQEPGTNWSSHGRDLPLKAKSSASAPKRGLHSGFPSPLRYSRLHLTATALSGAIYPLMLSISNPSTIMREIHSFSTALPSTARPHALG